MQKLYYYRKIDVKLTFVEMTPRTAEKKLMNICFLNIFN